MADAARLQADASRIRAAALVAVDPVRLVSQRLAAEALDLAGIERIVVVGAGKAAAGMAAGVEEALGPGGLARHRVSGLVSVPSGGTRTLARIEARETRPAGANLPTPAVEAATREMLAMLGGLGPRDLAVVVVTGGGSALLAAPRDGCTLEEKIALTKQLTAAGADIATLNAARRRMSAVKGGGLARACRAGRLLAIVLSDVIGDDLEVIASGPCMPGEATQTPGTWTTPAGCAVRHLLVGTNATAVDAAAEAARSLGYDVRRRHAALNSSTQAAADDVGRRLAHEARALATAVGHDGRPRAVVEGGESTVTLPSDHGRGGRNQQTILAAIAEMRSGGGWPAGVLVASLGTDGEDGPTEAAGALADADVAAAIAAAGLDLEMALTRRDAYPLLARAGGLVVTGPTGTNVADLRLILAAPADQLTRRTGSRLA
jgi:hydroxypyruvate reductase